MRGGSQVWSLILLVLKLTKLTIRLSGGKYANRWDELFNYTKIQNFFVKYTIWSINDERLIQHRTITSSFLIFRVVLLFYSSFASLKHLKKSAVVESSKTDICFVISPESSKVKCCVAFVLDVHPLVVVCEAMHLSSTVGAVTETTEHCLLCLGIIAAKAAKFALMLS